MKTCNKCKTEKPFEAFSKNKNKKDGYNLYCKECLKLRYLELKKNPLMQLEKQIRSSIRLENKLLKRENKRLCVRCKEAFLIEDLVSEYWCKECNIKYNGKYYEKNKEKYKEYQKEYYEKNKEKLNEYKKEYYEKNKEKLNEHQIQYRLKKKLEKLQNNDTQT